MFEQVGVDGDELQRNSYYNVDNDNANNDWNISDIRTTHLPAKVSALSSELQTNLTNTTIQTATNGNNGTLVSTSDKLFLAAEKEMFGTRVISRTEEFSALTTWQYRTTHTSQSDRIKYDPTSTARRYWLRSPRSNYGNIVIDIFSDGELGSSYATNSVRVSLCFAI